MSMVPDGPQLDPLKEAGEDTLEPDLNFWKQEWEVVCPEWKQCSKESKSFDSTLLFQTYFKLAFECK